MLAFVPDPYITVNIKNVVGVVLYGFETTLSIIQQVRLNEMQYLHRPSM